MSRIIYPERLSMVATTVGREDDEFFMFPVDRDHDDIFGWQDMLKDTIVPGCTIVTSFLEPDRLAAWASRHAPLLRIPRWVCVLAREHSNFLVYGFLGCVRYLIESGATVECYLPASERHMLEYYQKNDPGFEHYGIELKIIEAHGKPLKIAKVVGPEITVHRAAGTNEHHGIIESDGTAVEVTPDYEGVRDAWLGMPCSIPMDWTPSIASIIDWYEPDVIVDLGTNGYGSSAFLSSVSHHLAQTQIFAIENNDNWTKMYEKKLLGMALAERIVSIRMLLGQQLDPSSQDTQGLFQRGKKIALIVGSDFMEAGQQLCKIHEEILLITRSPDADMNTVIDMVGLFARKGRKVTLKSSCSAMIFERH